jgi:tetratricopeptide (TPR) repeat protein
MPDISKQEIKLFYCYAREDKSMRDELEKHLSNLKRQYHLTNWNDREILPGENWTQAIDKHLNTAHLVLLLISPDFMASDYCYGKEMSKALEREKAGNCRVIPIHLRPTDWEGAPFSHLQMLPTDARPVTSWIDRDSAFWDIAKEIRKALKELLVALKTKEQWLKEGDTFLNLKRYQEALVAYDQAIRLDHNYDIAYNNKGNALKGLNRYEEALAAYSYAIRLNPNLIIAYHNKGYLLEKLRHYEEALYAYDEARIIQGKRARSTEVDDTDVPIHHNKPKLIMKKIRYPKNSDRQVIGLYTVEMMMKHLTVEEIAENLNTQTNTKVANLIRKSKVHNVPHFLKCCVAAGIVNSSDLPPETLWKGLQTNPCYRLSDIWYNAAYKDQWIAFNLLTDYISRIRPEFLTREALISFLSLGDDKSRRKFLGSLLASSRQAT